MLNKLYFALIHPHLSYGILSWGNASETALQHTITLQKRAISMINKQSYNSHTNPLFRYSKIKKIKIYITINQPYSCLIILKIIAPLV